MPKHTNPSQDGTLLLYLEAQKIKTYLRGPIGKYILGIKDISYIITGVKSPKIFRNKEDRDLILSELTSLPEGFFAKFKKSYEKSIKELKMEKSEYVLNNDNYFDEGKGK